MTCRRRTRKPKNGNQVPRGFGHGPWGGCGVLPWGGSVPLIKSVEGLYVTGYKALYEYDGPASPVGFKAQCRPEFHILGYSALYHYDGPSSPVGFKAQVTPEFYVVGYKALYEYAGPSSPVGFKAKRIS